MSRGLRVTLGVGMALAVSACSVTEQQRSTSGWVPIAIDDTQEITRGGALRYAVIWTVEDGDSAAALVTDDGALTGTAASGAGVQFVEFSVPSSDVLAAAVPTEPLEMQRGVLADAFRPRVVVYEDTDGNGRLTPSVLGGSGLDRILAVDTTAGGPSVAALLDVESTLAELSLESTAAFYEATGDDFTPFVRAEPNRGALAWRITDAPVVLALSEGPRPAVELACLRQSIPGTTPALFATSRVDAVIDVALDAEASCGVLFENCESRDFAAQAPPDVTAFESDWRLGLAQCRDGGRVQVLVIHRAVLECEPCTCRTAAHADAWIADPASLPPWWPCGTDVAWCNSDLPLYTIDPLCIADEPEPG